MSVTPMRCSGTGPKVPYSWREVARLSDRRAAGVQLGGSSRFARRHRQPRPLLVPKTLSGLLARDDASPDPSDPHLGTSVPHPVSPAVWASSGLTDIHHQGHRPGKDVHNGDHGAEEAPYTTVVHSGVQG